LHDPFGAEIEEAEHVHVNRNAPAQAPAGQPGVCDELLAGSDH
jgi:hypothetical protein